MCAVSSFPQSSSEFGSTNTYTLPSPHPDDVLAKGEYDVSQLSMLKCIGVCNRFILPMSYFIIQNITRMITIDQHLHTTAIKNTPKLDIKICPFR